MLTKYFLSRIFSALPTLLLITILTFVLLRKVPGGPFDHERTFSLEVQQNIERAYGLDKPVVTQYFIWLKDILGGNLQRSFQFTESTVAEILLPAFSLSVIVGSLALGFSLVFGILLGVFSALAIWRKHFRLDYFLNSIIILGISLPVYFVATILILIFAFRLDWLPAALWSNWTSAVLPILALTFKPAALFARLVRTSLLEVLKLDYIRTAQSKGLHPFYVVINHALKNSLIPVISILGPVSAQLLTGSLVIESIFQIPGLGLYFVQSIINRDYPVAMGATLIFGVLLILMNLLSDFFLVAIDPRIHWGKSGSET